MTINVLYTIYIFITGSLIGSFANVLILRLPENEDYVFKRSHCPNCNSLIRWFDNIPIISYIFLKGKCRNCNSEISGQYPIIEALAAIWAIYNRHYLFNGEYFLFAFQFLVPLLFLIITVIDIRHYIIPNVLNLSLAVIFLLHAFFNNSIVMGLTGAFLGFSFTYLISFGFYKLRNKIGLGGGDIKLYGALGLFLGPRDVMYNIFLSCMIGSIFGLFAILIFKRTKEDAFPFGPFIVLAATLQIFFPEVYRIFN